MIVLIDDERNFHNHRIDDAEIKVFRTSVSALSFLKNFPKSSAITQLWLDHDLGVVDGKIDSTMPIVEFLEESYHIGEALKITEVVVHTMNNVAGRQIMSALDGIYDTVRVYAGDYLFVEQ